MAYKSGLDPENDPVVFTTDYGLEIRYANAQTTYLSEYTYFSAGGKNWVIIGYDPSMYEYVQDVSGEAFRDNPIEGGDRFTQFETIDDSAAGTAIMRDNFAISQAAETDFEIGEGCVLCLCETYVGEVQVNTSESKGNNYNGSYLQTYINETIYGGTSELSRALQALPIKPQTLTTIYYQNAVSTIENAYLFPLAGIDSNGTTTESFYVGTYLDTGEKRLTDQSWFLRSGNQNYSVSYYGVFIPDGKITHDYILTPHFVRPAFVLEL